MGTLVQVGSRCSGGIHALQRGLAAFRVPWVPHPQCLPQSAPWWLFVEDAPGPRPSVVSMLLILPVGSPAHWLRDGDPPAQVPQFINGRVRT